MLLWPLLGARTVRAVQGLHGPHPPGTSPSSLISNNAVPRYAMP